VIPNGIHKRLLINMQFSDTDWQTWWQPHQAVALEVPHKESTLKLSLQTRNLGDVVVVQCDGRIVYRDEASALTLVVEEFLQEGRRVVLDLSGVHSIDSAGIGELVWLHVQAQSKKADMRYACPSPLVRELLGLTNVDRVLEIHPSVHDALTAFDRSQACAQC
jgi:anti-anti-sigma factor